MNIVLASGSPRRKELLTQIGVDFTVEVSAAEEISVADKPQDICLFNATKKAEAVLALHAGEDVCIIGADTIVVLDDEVLGKPKDENDARAMIGKLSGKEHTVYTAVCALTCKAGTMKTQRFSEATRVRVATLTEAEIGDYVSTGESLDKAGAYGIQGLFARYIEGIEGDYFNVMGLPVGRLYREVLRPLI